VSLPKPVYALDGVRLYCGNALDLLPQGAAEGAGVLVTDPPYGIGYKSGHAVHNPASIAGDESTEARDRVLQLWGDRPALVFGTWKRPRPAGTRALLVWDTGGALGMGDLSLPWKPSHAEIYVLGRGFQGRRGTDVLRVPPVQSTKANGRTHPHEKPVRLLSMLIEKCPPGPVLDPFAGTGSTLLAARFLGREAIGFEIDPDYCKIIAERLAQRVLL